MLVVAALLAGILFALYGCGIYKPATTTLAEKIESDEARVDALTKREETYNTITTTAKRQRVTDWCRILFILGIAAGVFAVLRGNGWGLATILMSVAGLVAVHLDQKLAEIKAIYVLGGGLVISAYIAYFAWKLPKAKA